MKLRPFIFIYSAALLLWLGLTYVTPQPVQQNQLNDGQRLETQFGLGEEGQRQGRLNRP